MKTPGKAVPQAASIEWHTNSRRTVSKPGSYVVEVLGEDGAKLGEVAFTVK